jgi:hypothetical protein
MFMKKNTTKIFFLGFMITIIFVSNTACAARTVIIPENTAAILFIDSNGKIFSVADGKGEPAKPCSLPAERKPNSPPCKSLIKSTTWNRGDFMDVFVHKTNPCYMTLFVGGAQVEIPLPDAYCR